MNNKKKLNELYSKKVYKIRDIDVMTIKPHDYMAVGNSSKPEDKDYYEILHVEKIFSPDFNGIRAEIREIMKHSVSSPFTISLSNGDRYGIIKGIEYINIEGAKL